jgi:uncharacterized protein YdhG (YjbR/CyaY superfamily)
LVGALEFAELGRRTVKSEAKDVATYLAGVPEERREALKRLRSLCVATLKGCEECIDYGMPCYKRDGKLVASFASQKQYIGLYGMAEAVERYRGELTGCSMGKGCIRFRSAKAMDFDLIQKMLKDKATAMR